MNEFLESQNKKVSKEEIAEEIYKLSSLLILPSSLLIDKLIRQIIYNKKVWKLNKLQEMRNQNMQNSIPLKLPERIFFGVLIQRIYQINDLKLNGENFKDIEIWKMSDFNPDAEELQTECLLFITGDVLKNLFVGKKKKKLLGNIVLLNGISVLKCDSYDQFKNKFQSKKIMTNNKRVPLGVHVNNMNDILFIGKCKYFDRCKYEGKKKCKEVVNTERTGLTDNVLCHVHQNMIKNNHKNRRMDLMSVRKNKSPPGTYNYVHSVYGFDSQNIFINFKSGKKMKMIKKKKKKKVKDNIFKFQLNKENVGNQKITNNSRLGANMLKFKMEKDYRKKIEKVLIRNNKKKLSTKEIRLRAMKIANDSNLLMPPKRKVGEKSKMIQISLDSTSSDEDDFNQFQPLRKRRKLK